MNKIEAFWSEFLSTNKLDPNLRYITSFHFELSEKLANELLELVLEGKKKATASSLNSYEIEKTPLPKVGDYNIITDFHGNPKCVIMDTNITILPFKDMTFEICSKEGEDDNLESWIKGHTRFFIEEGKQLGYTFNEDMMVVFEEFEVVYIK